MNNAITIANGSEFSRLANAIRRVEEDGGDATGLLIELADFSLHNAASDQTEMTFAYLIYARLARLNETLQMLERETKSGKGTVLARANLSIAAGLLLGTCEGFFAAHGIGLDQAREVASGKA